MVSIAFDERPGAKAAAITRLLSAIQDVPFFEPPTAAELASAPVAELTLELIGRKTTPTPPPELQEIATGRNRSQPEWPSLG